MTSIQPLSKVLSVWFLHYELYLKLNYLFLRWRLPLNGKWNLTHFHKGKGKNSACFSGFDHNKNKRDGNGWEGGVPGKRKIWLSQTAEIICPKKSQALCCCIIYFSSLSFKILFQYNKLINMTHCFWKYIVKERV